MTKHGLAAPAAIVVFALLSGCGTIDLSGVGGESKFACSAPEGVSCMSVTGININASRGTLPAMQRSPADEARMKTKGETPARPTAGDDDQAKGQALASSAGATDKAANNPSYKGVSPAAMEAPYSGQPIRTPPKVLRVWIAPFEDSEADLHDQRYVYVTVHTGRWLIEANQAAVQRQYRPVFQLGKKGGADDGSDDQDSRKQVGPAMSDVPQRAPGMSPQPRSAGGQ